MTCQTLVTVVNMQIVGTNPVYAKILKTRMTMDNNNKNKAVLHSRILR